MAYLVPYLPLPHHYMSRFGEAIRERREVVGYKTATACAEASVKLEKENPAQFRSFSQSSLSRWELDKTGEYIESAHSKSLRTLAYLLQWTSQEFLERVGIPIGPVPLIEEQRQENMFGWLERYGEKVDLSIRIPFYGSLAAGIKGFEMDEEPEEWSRFAPEELPKGSDPKKLYLVRANGGSMYEENMSRPVPDGARLLVEKDAMPEEGQLVAAYIPELGIGVVKQFHRQQGDVVLRSYAAGGPMFWASKYPDMRVEGVIKRVIYEP